MARNYKRDGKGRFARTSSYHRGKASRIDRKLKSRASAERRYVKASGDVGTKRDIARRNARTNKLVAKRDKHRYLATRPSRSGRVARTAGGALAGAAIGLQVPVFPANIALGVAGGIAGGRLAGRKRR